MKNILTQLPEITGIKPRSIKTTMYSKSMENFETIDNSILSIPELSSVIAQQVKFSDIINGSAYVIEFNSGEVYINNIEKDGETLKLSNLNPNFYDMVFFMRQVKNVYEIYRVDTDR